jgi:hypothetical protein
MMKPMAVKHARVNYGNLLPLTRLRTLELPEWHFRFTKAN